MSDAKETLLAEAIYNKYRGKVVEIFVGEKVGTQFYAEEDREKRAYLTCTIDGYDGNLLTITCTVDLLDRSIPVEMSLFAWDVKGVMVKRDDGSHISQLFGDAKK